MLVIGDLLRSTARRLPDGEALVCDGQRMTWDELNRSVNRLANGLLARGVASGDRVAFIMGNSAELVRLYYAVAKIGAVSVPIMPRSVAREIRHIVTDAAATAIVAASDQAAAVREALPDLACVRVAVGTGPDHGLPLDLAAVMATGGEEEPPVDVDPGSLYAIQFTSGTTGAPKGCMLPHQNKVLSRMSMLTHVSYRPDDRALLFMPLAASLGADMLHAHVLSGVTTVLLPRFDEAEMLRLIETERITVLYAIGSTFDRLLAHQDLDRVDWARLRYFFATSSARDLRACVARLESLRNFRARLWSAYGSTEGGGWLTFLSPEDIMADSGQANAFQSIGRECMLAEVDCVDEQGHPLPAGQVGEMVLSAPWLFSGYWKQPEKTAEVLRGGRYFTGDLARKDENGFTCLEGRIKDMIKTGGLNVYPAEVEMVLKAHPKVREVAVVGVSDPEWGEKVVACVIPQAPCGEQELIDYCKTELAGYKAPKTVTFMPDFPRDVVGKILKRELRDQLVTALT